MSAPAVALQGAAAPSPLLAAHPGKRATERFWLLYTPVWGSVCAVVMLGGFAERWTDGPLLLLGVGLGMGAFVGPLLFRAPQERKLSLWRTTAFKYALCVAGFSFCMNYSQTPFFWDVLHMHYGFHSTIHIQNNPLFLYFLTIAYFSTYSVLLLSAYRFASSRLRRRPVLARVVGFAVVPFVVAALETALNANPWTTRLFCYDDMPFMMWFGTFAYGLAFVCALPMFLAIDERPTDDVPLWSVGVMLGAVMYADGLLLDGLRHWVAPHFTTVVEGANGLGDFATSCLAGPAG